MFETRVFVRKSCLIRPRKEAQPEFFGALAAIFIPVLVEKLIGTAASAFKKAGESSILRDAGRLPTYLYQLTKNGDSGELNLHPDFKSIIVVRGTFDKKNDPAPPKIDDSLAVTALRAGGIPVRQLGLVYEAEIEIAEDGTALRYKSRYFEVSRFIEHGKDLSEQKDHRGVVLNLTICGAGEKEGEPVLSTAIINLGDVNGRAILEPDDLVSKQSSWLGGLGITETSLKALETIKPAGDTLNVMPITIEAAIAETKDGNAALKFIGEVLDDTKKDVAQKVSGDILDHGKKASEAAASALEKLRDEEEVAFEKLLDAELALAKLTPGDPPTEADNKDLTLKRFAIETAGRAWCLKFGALQKLGSAPNRPGHTCP